MATLVMTSSGWSPGRIRVTYETFAGGMKITKLEGCRTDAYRSYLPSAKSVTFYTVSGYNQTVSVNGHYVDFGKSSSYTNWGLSNTTYVHGSGSVTLYIKLPTGSVAWSGATFSGTFTLPAYTSPSVASASAASNATGAITYSGSGSQGTQLIPSLLSASGYTQVNYVTAAGNTWIDTGLKAKGTTCIECAFQFTSATTQQRVFGVGTDSDVLATHFYINGSGSYAWSMQDTSGNWQALFTQQDNKVHTIKLDGKNGTVVFDGQSRSFSTTRSNTSTGNLALFGRSNAANYMTGHIYCCRIYDNGTLVRDFVPARRNSDSVFGLYDVKNGVFYTGKVNALSGTTSFNSPYVWNVNGNINAMSGTKTGLSQNTAYTCTFTVRDVLGLTASWSQSVTTKGSWTVSYAANGGTSTPSSQTKNYNVALTLAAAISKNNTTQNGYTVTFDPNTGSVSPTSKTATDTVKWTFSKWKATNGTQYNASASYTANESTTMTAQWTSSISSRGSITTPSASKTAGTSTRKVDFDAATNGGSCSTASLNSTATVTYSSSGWYTATSGGTKRCVNGGSYTPSSSETVHAQWTSSTGSFSAITLPNATHVDSSSTRTVSFDATTNGGTCSTPSLNSVATVTHPLNGWYTASSGGTKRGTYNQTYTPSAAEKLYAQFGSNTGTFSAITLPAATKANGSTSRTITINANGGTSTITTLTSEATITYSQTGWWTSASGGTNRGNSGASYTPSATEQVYAQFSSSTGTYSTVTFPDATECTQTGYILLGFDTSSSATTPTYQPGETITPTQSDIYYAIWVPAITYTVTYNANGGTSTPASQTKIHDVNLTLAAGISRDEVPVEGATVTFHPNGGHTTVSSRVITNINTYRFYRWRATNGTDYLASGTYTANESTIMTARWDLASTRCGSVNLPDATECTRQGYLLLGFDTSPTATTPTYQPGDSVSSWDDIIYYAIWERLGPQIYKNINGTWYRGDVFIKINGTWISADEVYIKLPVGNSTYQLVYIDNSNNTGTETFATYAELESYMQSASIVFKEVQINEIRESVWTKVV